MCANKTFSYDHIKDVWTCGECTSLLPKRYNPFESIFYDKYQEDDSGASDEINHIINILENCNSYDFNSVDKSIDQNKKLTESISVCFNNIDGVTSNFDTFSAELSTLRNNFNILSLAETNIDSSHKDLFTLPGYQSVYQSKIVHKRKGSGLGIYIENKFIFDTNDECSQCSKDMESLFVTITNTSQPVTFGVIYRPPSGNIEHFFLQFESILKKLPQSNVIITGDFNIDLHQHINTNYEDLFLDMDIFQ